MVLKNHYQTIKDCYLDVFNNNKEIKDRKLAARNVVSTIIDGVFFEKYEIQEAFNSFKKNYSTKYRDSFTGKLNFLCDFGYIEPTLQSEYYFIYDEAGKHSTAHLIFKSGEERIIHVKKIFLNEILESFLIKSDESADYLKPMSVISNDDPEFHKRIVERIDDFWNIKKNKNWFVKYKTILSYILGLIFSFISPLISIFFILSGIYITQKFVFNKTLKVKRYLMFGVTLALSIFNIFLASYIINDFEKKSAKFDSDPFGYGRGFMLVSDSISSFSLKHAKDTLFMPILAKGENKDVYIYHGFKNIGSKPLEGGNASLDIIENNKNIIFKGKLYKDLSEIISESVVIMNINTPYNIEFIEGQITNENIKNDNENCSKFLYKKPLWKIYYKDNYIENTNLTYKGIQLNMLSHQNEGNCDAGYIISRFRITKL